MRLVFVTGMSGAGKTTALKMLEDAQYFCVDNLPIPLLGKFVSLMSGSRGEDVQNAAIGIDARSGRALEELEVELEKLSQSGQKYEILFLDASDAVIRRRYKETRRQHPLSISDGLPIQEAVARERQVLQPLRDRAKYVIDTSLLSAAQNRERVCGLFLNRGQSAMALTIMSFGFKYGLPPEADIVFDVRCLPNPFYVPELKNQTGLDQAVVDYVMDAPESRELLKRMESLLEYALPLYVKEGKSQLVIAVGCTGGKHRSITFARLLGEFCQKQGYAPAVQHRDARRNV